MNNKTDEFLIQTRSLVLSLTDGPDYKLLNRFEQPVFESEAEAYFCLIKLLALIDTFEPLLRQETLQHFFLNNAEQWFMREATTYNEMWQLTRHKYLIDASNGKDHSVSDNN